MKHPHAESMLLWAEDHATIPPAHEWECCVSDDNWYPVDPAGLKWVPSTKYRRMEKPAPNYSALSSLKMSNTIYFWNGNIPNELAKAAGVRLLSLLEDNKELSASLEKMGRLLEEVRDWVKDAPNLDGESNG